MSSGGRPGSTRPMALPITGPGSPPGEGLGSWGLRVWVLVSQSTGGTRSGMAAAAVPPPPLGAVGSEEEASHTCHRKPRAWDCWCLFLPAVSPKADSVSSILIMWFPLLSSELGLQREGSGMATSIGHGQGSWKY